MEKVKWGIIGTGTIAQAFAQGIMQSQTSVLTAVASRSNTKAISFVEKNKCPQTKAYGNYDALLEDSEVEAVYIALPHVYHAEWSIKAAQAQKHILCEKPATVNHAEAMIVWDAITKNKVCFMEGFMYRFHPQMQKIAELIQCNQIGKVNIIQSNFGFTRTINPQSRLYSKELAGGGILEVGCYPVSVSRWIAGLANQVPYIEPVKVESIAQIGITGVDEWATATLLFPGDIVAQIAASIRSEQENSLRVFGETGAIVVPDPWYGGGNTEGQCEIHIYRDEQIEETFTFKTDKSLYTSEIDAFVEEIRGDEATFPIIPVEDTLGNMNTLDQWRQKIELIYPFESANAYEHPTNKGTLRKKPQNDMIYGSISGVTQPVSRLIMGVDNQRSVPHAFAMFDDYFERGGNAFDTAHFYFGFEGGHCESLLGDWIKNRGVREDIVLISKGAHTPNCTPAGMAEEFRESLERLQTDYADIYILHRDNLEVPVGEFVDVLYQHLQSGKIKAYGGSNWSIKRVAEANAYAEKYGMQPFSVLSNQFSLAQMVQPIWEGCLSASDPASIEWLKNHPVSLLAYSSQARGYFTEQAGRTKTNDIEHARFWSLINSDANSKRRDRAFEMAKAKGVKAINIALAYVLSQPFEAFALIGPRFISETVSSFESLKIQLNTSELKWLNSGTFINVDGGLKAGDKALHHMSQEP